MRKSQMLINRHLISRGVKAAVTKNSFPLTPSHTTHNKTATCCFYFSRKKAPICPGKIQIKYIRLKFREFLS